MENQWENNQEDSKNNKQQKPIFNLTRTISLKQHNGDYLQCNTMNSF